LTNIVRIEQLLLGIGLTLLFVSVFNWFRYCTN